MENYMTIPYKVMKRLIDDGVSSTGVLMLAHIANKATMIEQKGTTSNFRCLPFETNQTIADTIGVSPTQVSLLIKKFSEMNILETVRVHRKEYMPVRSFVIVDKTLLEEYGLKNMTLFAEQSLETYKKHDKIDPDKKFQFFNGFNDVSCSFKDFSIRLDNVSYVRKFFIYHFTKEILSKFNGVVSVWDGKGSNYSKTKKVFNKMENDPLTEGEIKELVSQLAIGNFGDHGWLTKVEEYYSMVKGA